METFTVQQLLEKYLTGSMTYAEITAFKTMLHRQNNDMELKGLIDKVLLENRYQGNSDLDAGALFNSISANLPAQHSITRSAWFRSAAAILVIAAGISVAYYLNNKKTAVTGTQTAQKIIGPGTNRAILTLSNGQTIMLDSAEDGRLALQGNTTVVKLSSGQLAYKAAPATAQPTGKMEENLLTVPKGGQYQVVLPDGSAVWLNSASSLRFPPTFNGKERKVELTGEAYFEIAANASQPFIVKAAGSEVKVLGTAFNMNAYSDEPGIYTTLINGKVQAGTHILRPGQQAALPYKQTDWKISEVDVEPVIAWKKGYFQFKSAEIETIMRQLSRWYNIDVQYGSIIKDRFYVDIPKNTHLSDVLKALELTGQVKFIIKDRTITVTTKKQ